MSQCIKCQKPVRWQDRCPAHYWIDFAGSSEWSQHWNSASDDEKLEMALGGMSNRPLTENEKTIAMEIAKAIAERNKE